MVRTKNSILKQKAAKAARAAKNLPSTTPKSGQRGRAKVPAMRKRKPSTIVLEVEKQRISEIEDHVDKVAKKVDDEVLTDVVLKDENMLSQENVEVQEATQNIIERSTKVAKMYKRYQTLWKDYVSFHEITNEWDQQALIGFFSEMAKSYSPSTVWVIYSCINSHFITKYGEKLNKVIALQRFLKQLTSRYVCKKSNIFSAKQIHQVMEFALKSEKKEDMLMGVGVALLYYGLMRCSDVLNIQIQDVSVGKMATPTVVNFDHGRKRRNEGYKFHVPFIYNDIFLKYDQELNVKSKANSRYLKNWVEKNHSRSQNAGKNTVTRFISRMCEILGVPYDGYTTHCFRRSAATNLADAGVSFINLKRHGQWLSDTVVEGYIANSVPIRKEREEFLLPEEMQKALAELDIDSLVKKHEQKKQKLTLPPIQDLPMDEDSVESDDIPILELVKKNPVRNQEEKIVCERTEEKQEDLPVLEVQKKEEPKVLHEVEYLYTHRDDSSVEFVGSAPTLVLHEVEYLGTTPSATEYQGRTRRPQPIESNDNVLANQQQPPPDFPVDVHSILSHPTLPLPKDTHVGEVVTRNNAWGTVCSPTFNSCNFYFS